MAHYLSKEGLKKIKDELAEREGISRAEIAARIVEAKELGDLSENAEYTEAREAQSMNEGRIEEIKEILRVAVVVDSNRNTQDVGVGSTVEVKSNATAKNFTIVGPAESNPAKGFISYESPLGAAFMGKKKGDLVNVETPSGEVQYKIMSIK